MAEMGWGKESDRLIRQIEQKHQAFERVFERLCVKLRAGKSDSGLVKEAEAADTELRRAKDALYRHAQEHAHKLGF
jgi:hypothetical protein